MIAKLPDAAVKALDKRYGPLTLEPRKLKFIDRIVADSRDVALNHTAGLSLPQQVMMSLFSLSRDDGREEGLSGRLHGDRQRRAVVDDRRPRRSSSPRIPTYDAYYGLIDFEFWARKNIGDEAVDYLKKNVHPLDLAFRLAEAHGIVLLNGGGFEAPELVAAGLAGKPARRGLRGHRARRARHRARLPGRLRGGQEAAQSNAELPVNLERFGIITKGGIKR